MDSIDVKKALKEAFAAGASSTKNNFDQVQKETVAKIYSKYGFPAIDSWREDSRVERLAKSDLDMIEMWIKQQPDQVGKVVENFTNLHIQKLLGVVPVEKDFPEFEHIYFFNSLTRKIAHLDECAENSNINLVKRTIKGNELLPLKTDELSELTLKVVSKISEIATTKTTWDFHSAFGDTVIEKYESLYIKLIETSNLINNKTLRGGANFIITSPEIGSIFQTATSGYYYVDSNPVFGLVKDCGTVNSRWRLFENILMKQGKIIMGYKGKNNLDSGLFLGIKNLAHNTQYCFAETPNSGDYYAIIDVENFMI